jgi:hypothetical protein
VEQGDVTSLLAVLIENIHITNVMWFLKLKPFMTLFCTNRRHCSKLPIATKAVGYTMDIPADEYLAKRAAQTNAATTPQPLP